MEVGVKLCVDGDENLKFFFFIMALMYLMSLYLLDLRNLKQFKVSTHYLSCTWTIWIETWDLGIVKLHTGQVLG
jgi:hypothetical protein